MNIGHKLFDEQFVLAYFKKRLLPEYKDFKRIKKIKIIPHKKGIWGEEHFHVVAEYSVYLEDKNGKVKKLPIFCSAHSHEPRKNVYRSLKFLWDSNFCSGHLTVPHPLFYSQRFKATFYRGVKGKNLYYYIQHNDREEVKNMAAKAARWFVKLHQLPIDKAINFNKLNSRIETVIPGVKLILEKTQQLYPDLLDIYKKAYEEVIKREKKFLNSRTKRWLVHGDAHPENIIKMGKKKIAVIDFTDLCLSDFARDLGTFLQQVEYMVFRKTKDKEFSDSIMKIFLENYIKYAKIRLDDSLEKRIDTYYAWTAMRTATFFLLKEHPEPERADYLINQFRKKLDI